MKVFDQINPQTLERREWELWLLTLGMILVLATGVALLMYPMVFSRPVPFSLPAMRGIFFGYCGLSFLLVVYLVNRQIVIRHLRRQVAEGLSRNIFLRHKASVDLLGSLPKFDRFQDRLAMDFRRAANSQQPLSLVIARLTSSGGSTDETEVDTALGDAANALLRRLRGDDSIYQFQRGIFGILLPGTGTAEAQRISNRLGEAITDASGTTNRFTFGLQVVNYPEQAESARELEESARVCLAETGGVGGEGHAA
jgi:GGDEF domain-containing protein